jgi:hypothetical protein
MKSLEEIRAHQEMLHNASQPTDEPPAPLPKEIILPPGVYDNLTASKDPDLGEELYLSSGDYYIKDDVELSNLIIAKKGGGAVRIFVGQKATLQSSTVNASFTEKDGKNPRPKDFQFLFLDQLEDEDTGEMNSQFFLSDSLFSGVACSEKLQVAVENSEVFGTVVGEKVRLSQSQLHHDKDVESVDLTEVAKWSLTDITVLEPNFQP